jgi:hypothetical protein
VSDSKPKPKAKSKIAASLKMIGAGRPPKTYGEGRVCATEGCSTLLSRYNRGDRCFPHSPLRYPRTRGQPARVVHADPPS